MALFILVIVLLAALAAWVIWRSIAAAESQGAESTMGVPGVELRRPLGAPTDLPGPGAEEAVPEPAERPDPHAQWDEVRGIWEVWHPVLARWVPWEPDIPSGPPPPDAPPRGAVDPDQGGGAG